MKFLLLLLALCKLSSGQSPLTFMVLGDWGERITPTQQQVADAMALLAADTPQQFFVSTGDNFYPKGVDDVNSTLFDSLWRDIYYHDSIKDLPWYITVGNHDYDGNEYAQVEFSSIEPLWIFPHLWHKASFMAETSSVELYMVDSPALREEINDYETMMQWLEDELIASQADYKLVFAHRQIYSTGDYGPTDSTMYNEMRPILEANGVDMYVNGHDHSLQYITDMDDPTITDYVISASGGGVTYPYSEEAEEQLNTIYNKEVLFFNRTNGFIAFTIDDVGITTDYYDDSEELTMIYSHVRPKYN